MAANIAPVCLSSSKQLATLCHLTSSPGAPLSPPWPRKTLARWAFLELPWRNAVCSFVLLARTYELFVYVNGLIVLFCFTPLPEGENQWGDPARGEVGHSLRSLPRSVAAWLQLAAQSLPGVTSLAPSLSWLLVATPACWYEDSNSACRY